MMDIIVVPPSNDERYFYLWLVIGLLLFGLSYDHTGVLAVPVGLTVVAAMNLPQVLLKLFKLRRVVMSQRDWKVVKGIVKASRVYMEPPYCWSEWSEAPSAGSSRSGKGGYIYELSVEYEVPDKDGTVIQVEKYVHGYVSIHRCCVWRTTVPGTRPENRSEIDLLVFPGLPKSGVQRELFLNERRWLIFECLLNVPWLFVWSIIPYVWWTIQDIDRATLLIWATATALYSLTYYLTQCTFMFRLCGATILEEAKNKAVDKAHSANVIGQSSKPTA